jgi:hypothetical protein
VAAKAFLDRDRYSLRVGSTSHVFPEEHDALWIVSCAKSFDTLELDAVHWNGQEASSALREAFPKRQIGVERCLMRYKPDVESPDTSSV